MTGGGFRCGTAVLITGDEAVKYNLIDKVCVKEREESWMTAVFALRIEEDGVGVHQ